MQHAIQGRDIRWTDDIGTAGRIVGPVNNDLPAFVFEYDIIKVIGMPVQPNIQPLQQRRVIRHVVRVYVITKRSIALDPI